MRDKIKKIKSKILKILKENKITRAGVFGSYARGEEKKNSDIDILVEIKNPKVSLLDFVRIERKLKEKLGLEVDLLEYKSINPLLKKRILEEEIKII